MAGHSKIMGWLLAALLSTAWSPAVRTFIPSKPTAACVTSIQRVGVPVAAQGDDGTLQEEIGNAFGAWYDEIRMQGMALGGYPASVVARPVQPWQLRLVFEGRDAFTVLPADATTDELAAKADALYADLLDELVAGKKEEKAPRSFRGRRVLPKEDEMMSAECAAGA